MLIKAEVGTPRRLARTSTHERFPVHTPHNPLRSFLGFPALALNRGGTSEQFLSSLSAPLQNYIFLNTRRSACDEDHRQKSTSRKVTNRARAVWTLHLAFDPQQSRCRFARDGNAIAKTF